MMEDARFELLEGPVLARLNATFQRDGIAVLANVVPAHVLDVIARRLDFDAAHQVQQAGLVSKAPRDAGDFSFAGIHLENGLPRTREHIFPEVLANPIIEQVVVTLLGGPAFIRYYNGNTACPNSDAQDLHMDGGGWSVPTVAAAAAAGLNWPHEPMKLSVNFGVDDMVPSNGCAPTPPLPKRLHTSCRATRPTESYLNCTASLYFTAA